MTKEAFEKVYAERSGLTVDELHGFGLFAYPCHCGQGGCAGWQIMDAVQYEERTSNGLEHCL